MVANFWFGVVEDIHDPLQSNRVRVRVHGSHSPMTKDIPKEHLPWAIVAMPNTSASNSGVGSSSGITHGSWVLGFWADEKEGQQFPVILATIPGLIPETKTSKPSSIDAVQQNSKKGFYEENYGDVFRDPRTEEELKQAPTNKFKKKKFPDGKDKEGDEHGAQIENDKAEIFPRNNSYSCVPYNDGKLSDISVIAINDKEHIDKTIIGYKRTPREKGGLLDEDIKIAIIDFKTFKCGVTNESKINKGTNKDLGIGDNSIESTNVPSVYENYKAVKGKPTNSNGKPVYKDPDEKSSNTEQSSSSKKYNSQQEFFDKASQEELEDYFYAKTAGQHPDWDDNRIEAQAKREAQQTIGKRQRK